MSLVRRSRGGRRHRVPTLRIGLVLLGAAVFFAPQLALKTPVKDWILQNGVEGLDLKASVGGIRAGWFSPITILGLTVTGIDGDPLLEADSIRSEQSLFALLIGRFGRLSLTVERPQLHLVTRADGSNIEDLLAKWREQPSQESEAGATISIEGGTLTAVDTVSGARWSATEINAKFVLPNDPSHGFQAEIDSALAAESAPPGSFKATTSAEGSATKLLVDVAGLPLSVGETFARRFDPTFKLTGRVTGRVEFESGPTHQSVRFEQLTVENLSVGTSRWLWDDRFEVPLLKLAGTVSRQGAGWELADIDVQSDVLKLQATGRGELKSDADGVESAVWHWISNSSLKARGRIDLARLSSTIPQTMRLREGTRITSGNVDFTVDAKASDGVQSLTGAVETEQLAAVAGADRITWDDPLSLSIAARNTQGVWTFDRVVVRASSLNLTGNGSATQGAVSMNGDLGEFAGQIGRFVDLGNNEVGGEIEGSARWQRQINGEVTIEGSVRANNFAWISSERDPWRENSLSITLTGTGLADQTRLTDLPVSQVISGSVQLESGTDRCQVLLLAPVSTVDPSSRWPLQVKLNGNLETWLPRLRFWVPLNPSGWAGRIDLNADLAISQERIETTAAKAVLEDLTSSAAGLRVREPRLEIEMKGGWDLAAQCGVAEYLSLAGSAVALRAEDLRFQIAPVMQWSGRVGYRADLERLSAWRASRESRVRGQLLGHVEFSSDGNATNVSWSTHADRLDYSVYSDVASSIRPAALGPSQWKSVWAEDQLEFSGNGRFDPDGDQAIFEKLEIRTPAVSVGASGSVTDLSQQCVMKLDGQIAYDLQRLTDRFGSPDFLLVGKGSQPFKFQGPLLASVKDQQLVSLTPERVVTPQWTEIVAAAKLGWTSARFQGIDIGPGTVDSRLQDGVVSFIPVDLTVSGGRVLLTPELDLRREPLLMRIPAGPLAERVQILPEMCRTWLKYVAPLVADATAVEGELSITLEESLVPLSAPAAGDIGGVLDIHTLQVGPGALTQQFLLLADQLKNILERNPSSNQRSGSQRWVRLPEQQVAFHLKENRVHHEGLQLVVDDVVIRTSGSVGLDQSLSMVATVPIQDEWVVGDRYLSALRGQTLQVPVRGTLSNPKLDVRVLDQLAQQFLGGAAKRLIEQELGRGLQRLLGQ